MPSICWYHKGCLVFNNWARRYWKFHPIKGMLLPWVIQRFKDGKRKLKVWKILKQKKKLREKEEERDAWRNPKSLETAIRHLEVGMLEMAEKVRSTGLFGVFCLISIFGPVWKFFLPIHHCELCQVCWREITLADQFREGVQEKGDRCEGINNNNYKIFFYN